MIAGICGALCIGLGAMAAHALTGKIPAENMQTFETASKYLFYKTIGLVIVAFIIEKDPSKYMKYAGWLFITAIVLFSGSLYFLSLRPLMGIPNEEMRWVGAITPFGGISHILAWIMIFISAYKKRT